MANSNTRSGNVVSLTATPSQTGDCISDKMMRELIRRITATVVETSTPGDAVVSRTPPTDTNKIWYPADENGTPIGTAYKFDPLQGQWVSTAVVPQPPPCRSSDADNLITIDAAGCWKVDYQTIENIANSASLKVSADSGNAIMVGSDGGLYVDVVDTSVPGQVELYDNPVFVASATADTASTDVDLNGVVGVAEVPAWATHAIIRAKCSLFTNNINVNSTNKAYVRVRLDGHTVAQVGPTIGPNNQSDSAGDDTNDVYVKLDNGVLTYEFDVNESPNWTTADIVDFSLHLLGWIRASEPL